VRLHAAALADFERKRVKIVNPALVRRPRAMETKLTPIASPALDDLPPDFDDGNLLCWFSTYETAGSSG
jgi:hypothetical protein